ncbi:MAG TPA: GyrI-like domain-containing protein [Candidatus Binatia bacterium]|jgi:AraC family transcriptional regulator|nr:GyrI-like domain-containing protein [Candidatus Binatia bacterium]
MIKRTLQKPTAVSRREELLIASLEPPRFINRELLLIAGLSKRCTNGAVEGIPAQWQRFESHIGNIRGQVGQAIYGVISDRGAEDYDYLSGVEVSDFSDLPADFSRACIPAGTYAVFDYCGHVSAIRNTCDAIWNQWLAQSGYEVLHFADSSSVTARNLIHEPAWA